MRRAAAVMLLGLALLAGAGVAALATRGGGQSSGSGSASPAASLGGGRPSGAGPGASAGGSPAGTAGTTASPALPGPTESPAGPTPSPSPTFVSRLTGLPTTAAKAKRHPIAVMIDDHWDARPQSGFNQAGIVWHALAEGGIPRYMMIFADVIPAAVGPVRSAREYFLEWAAEWRAVYAHAGGSPQAMRTLRSRGSGQWVYDADSFRWEGRYLWRISTRRAPHNLYTDGKNLRSLGARLKAKDVSARPAWKFAVDAPLDQRPKGGRIEVRYRYNRILYKYDRASNTYRRFVEGKAHVDAADKKQVAPRNVVVMVVKFGPLNDGNPAKGRLEARIIGKGTAWISTNGVTIKGSWRKGSVKGPTRFYDRTGREVVLTAGQTFIEVIPSKGDATFKAGTRPGGSPSASPGASPSPAASGTPTP